MHFLYYGLIFYLIAYYISKRSEETSPQVPLKIKYLERVPKYQKSPSTDF